MASDEHDVRDGIASGELSRAFFDPSPVESEVLEAEKNVDFQR